MMKKLSGRQIRTMRTVTIVGTLISGIVFSLSACLGHWIAIPAAVVLIGLVVADLIICRCPCCGHYLHILTQERCFCPYCGRELG